MKRLFNTEFQRGNLDIALLITRLGIGGMMLTHGVPKLLSLFGTEPIQFPGLLGMSPEFALGLTVFSEVVCSILIILGLMTRLASIPLIITMMVAVFYIHSADPFVNKEMGLHYLLAYIVLLLLGSGRLSLDAFFSKKQINK